LKPLTDFIQGIDWQTSGKWTILSVLVGIVMGLVGIVFSVLCQFVLEFSLVEYSGYFPGEAIGEYLMYHPDENATLSLLMIVVVMTFGGIVSGWLVYTFAPNTEGSGTDSAIDAYHNQQGRIHWKTPLIKIIASAVTLGTGGSAGREGPIGQIGAGIGSVLGTILKLPARDRRILLAAGMGAGIGAFFRAPLAGALFAAEILYSDSDFEADVIIPAATASIIGYSVYTFWLPESIANIPLFGDALDFRFESPLELLPYFVLALVLVAFSALHVFVLNRGKELFTKVPIPRFIRPGLGAGLAGVLAVGFYICCQKDARSLSVISTGYGMLQEVLNSASEVGIPLLLGVAVVKMLTTALTISSGGSGGVFGPSMVIGGCVGAAVGLFFHDWVPDIVPHPEAFAIVGMAGFFAVCANAPFSTIIMVSELTGGYGLLLPTMWVSTLTFAMGRRWRLYQHQVPSRLESPAHRGDFLVDVLEGIRVSDVFQQRNVTSIPESMSLDDIVHTIAKTRQHYFPVVDENGRMIGIFSADDCRSYLYDDTLWALANARDVMNPTVVCVTPDDDLNTAMRCFTSVAIDEIPVVDVEDRGKLLGTLRHKETIAAYNRRLMEFKRQVDEHAS